MALPRLSFPCLVASILCAQGAAQCSLQWEPWDYPGIRGQVAAMTSWDPDGPGPLPPRLAFAGSFTNAGFVPANNVVGYDPATGQYSALASGLDARAYAVAVLPSGDLVVGGLFATAGGVPARGVALWNGTAWSSLGTGLGGPSVQVRSLVVLPSGELVVGGSFQTAGGVTANGLARWDGTSWSAMGASAGSMFYALSVMPNGDLVAGGAFNSVGSVATSGIARYDGLVWSSFGTGISNTPYLGRVYALATAPNGDLIVGGTFAAAGSIVANYIARWNGTTWFPMGAGFGPGSVGRVLSVNVLPNGDVLAGGWFQPFGGGNQNGIARWDGTAWQNLGSGCDFEVQSMLGLANGHVLAGGAFPSAGGAAGPLAEWDGTTWSSFGVAPRSGTGGTISAVATMSNGDLVVGGAFTNAGGVAAFNLARWNGASWSAAPGYLGPYNQVWIQSLLPLPNGEVVVGGEIYTSPGGSSGIARWDGSQWLAMGTGTSGNVRALARMRNGDVIAGGSFSYMNQLPASCIARWDGLSWSALGAGLDNEVYAALPMPNGDLIVGGLFANAGGAAANHIARWNGAVWSPLGSGTNGMVRSLGVLPTGEIVAAGSFSLAGGVAANGVAQWNGSSWSAMGAGFASATDVVSAIAVLPDGGVLAGGRLTIGSNPSCAVARWDGAAWSPVGAGAASVSGSVQAFTRLPSGDFMAGGALGGPDFSTLARLSTTCPALVQRAGNGCPSSGGSNTLAAVTLPWANGTFEAIGTGLPQLSMVIAATSLTSFPQGLHPLNALVSLGVAGCDVLVDADILSAIATANGTVTSQMFLPNVPALVGVTFYHQMIPIEIDASGHWVSVTATNALRLTVGFF